MKFFTTPNSKNIIATLRIVTIERSENFKGKIFYSHGTTNSFGVSIAFLGSKSLEVNETKNDDQSRILILDLKICDK